MGYIQRQLRILLLSAFFIIPIIIANAQNDAVVVVGSGIVAPAFEALIEASETALPFDLSVTGTRPGLTAFCAGSADIVITNRPISLAEESECIGAGVEFYELLLGHNILALVTNPDSDFAQCLSQDDINTLFAPTAEGQISDWSQLDTEFPETPLTPFVPPNDTAIYGILDRIVDGDGIRGDAEVFTDSAEIIDTIGSEPGALAALDFVDALAAGDRVEFLEIDSGATVGCSLPSASNVEDRAYTLADRLLMYANRNLVDSGRAQSLLDLVASDQAAEIVAGQGLVAPSPTAYEINWASIQSKQGGRQFSLEAIAFDIPTNLTGEVNIGGAAHAFNYLSSIINIFSGAQPGVTVNMEAEGEPAGLRRLCNGENDIAVATSELSSDQAANCEANDISTQTLDLGTETVVLLANGESSYLDCLTTDQISTIWGADSTETINNWQAVDSNLPDIDMTLFAPIAGDHYTDLLLTQSSGRALANRLDTELDRDPLYRAAATANVAGALTYMGWPDYLNVLINQQTNVQLVAVDGGEGCVSPDEASISSRSYPLVRSLKLIINRSSLADPVVQSFLWFLASDENFSVLDNSGFIGIDFGDLPIVRATLRRAFLEAQAERFAASIEPESTEEPIVETTPETTEEAAVETVPESND